MVILPNGYQGMNNNMRNKLISEMLKINGRQAIAKAMAQPLRIFCRKYMICG